VRRSKKGWPPVVKIGYARPRATRGLHPSGLREVLVWRPEDLKNIDTKLQVARIAHTVGENKRVLILEEAKKTSIRILNPGLKKAPAAEAAPSPEPEVGAEAGPEAPPEKVEAQKPAKKAKKRTTAKKRKTKGSKK
jgi:large subunit ribosomal protein L32e